MKKEGTAQQQNGKCMACNQSVVSTGAFKFQSHIIVCPLLPAAVKKPFKELREGTTNKASEKWEVAVLQKEEAQIAALQHAASQQQLKQQCIRAGIHCEGRDPQRLIPCRLPIPPPSDSCPVCHSGLRIPHF